MTDNPQTRIAINIPCVLCLFGFGLVLGLAWPASTCAGVLGTPSDDSFNLGLRPFSLPGGPRLFNLGGGEVTETEDTITRSVLGILTVGPWARLTL